MSRVTGKAPTDPHFTTLTPNGYIKLPAKILTGLGLGAGQRVELVLDAAAGHLVVRVVP